MIGSFGIIIFSVSSLEALTFTKFTRKISKRTVNHEVIRGKPRTEFLGADLQSVTFDIHLDVNYGVKPRLMIDTLEKMTELGIAYPLVIGGRPIGTHNWSLDSITVSDDVMYSRGELASADVTLSLTEYVPTL